MNNEISVLDSKKIYGIAILLMIVHHCYKSIDFAMGMEWLMRIGWIGKICVGMFSFISGYGLGKKFADKNLKQQYVGVTKQILKMMIKYWVVFVFALPYILIRFTPSFNTLFFNFIGYSFDFNGAWWYVKQYVIMLLFFPLITYLVKLLNRINRRIVIIGYILLVSIIFILYYFSSGVFNRIASSVFLTYILIFIEGYLYSVNLFKNVIPSSKIVNSLVLLICFIIRYIISINAAYSLIDIIIIPLIIYSLRSIIRQGVGLNILLFYSSISTYVWLTHCFFISPIKELLQYKSISLLFVFIIVLFLSTISGLFLKIFESKVVMRLIRSFSIQKNR